MSTFLATSLDLSLCSRAPLNSLTRGIYNECDDPLLKYLDDDGQSIEPEWYMPILPTVRMNIFTYTNIYTCICLYLPILPTECIHKRNMNVWTYYIHTIECSGTSKICCMHQSYAMVNISFAILPTLVRILLCMLVYIYMHIMCKHLFLHCTVTCILYMNITYNGKYTENVLLLLWGSRFL